MMRRIPDTERIRGYRHPGRRWLAFILICSAIAGGAWLFSQDTGWETRQREARRHAHSAETGGNYVAARTFYETALANNPYDWETHLSLARILNRRFGDYDNAMRHYNFALGYAPDPAAMRNVQRELAVILMIRQGELENPWDAVEDIFLAVEANTEALFRLRLSPRLNDAPTAYWNAWRTRGRGTIVYCSVKDETDGFFDANIELVFSDGTSMSMHWYCVKGQVWRMEASFP